MKKFDFNQPKFIFPLIALPFLFVAFYIYGEFFAKNEVPESNLVVTEGINTIIPEPTDIKQKNKLESFIEALNTTRETTAIIDIPEEERKRIEKEKSDSIARIAKRDSLKMAFDRARQQNRKISKQTDISRQNLLDIANGKKPSNSVGNNTNSSGPKQNLSKEEQEMEAFKKQMIFIDSMANPEKYKRMKAIEEAKKNFEDQKQGEQETLTLSKEKASSNSYFNTVKANNDENFISAILDQGIKVWDGSRVRIRLLEEVFLGDHLLEKGKYLYGIVSGFDSQRIKISVTSIVIKGQILPVEINLYDNDGIEGIYIPDSSFRAFAKELGKESARDGGTIDFDDNPQSGTEVLYESVSTSFKSASKAVQKALTKNKAKLKYNTQVYLVNKQ